MEKVKNFIYDKSDLLLALLIVAVAALIIWFGISNIMKPYTDKAEARTDKQVEQSVANDEPVAATDQQTSPAASEEPNDQYVTKKTAKIIIQPGEDSDQIADKLIAAGAITDKNTFYAKLDELGISTRIQEGSFEIPAGSSLEAVCRIITKTN